MNIGNMTKTEMLVFIQRRLQGLTTTPYVQYERGERPEDYIMHIYDQIESKEVEEKLKEAIGFLTADTVSSALQKEALSYTSGLLRLVEYCRVEDAYLSVKRLFDNLSIIGKCSSDYYNYLGIQIILTLSYICDIKEKKLVGRFKDLLSIEEYMPPAFLALAETKEDKLKKTLKKALKNYEGSYLIKEELQEVYNAYLRCIKK